MPFSLSRLRRKNYKKGNHRDFLGLLRENENVEGDTDSIIELEGEPAYHVDRKTIINENSGTRTILQPVVDHENQSTGFIRAMLMPHHELIEDDKSGILPKHA